MFYAVDENLWMFQAIWKFICGFGYAFRGIWILIRSQRNAQIHCLALVVVAIAGWLLKISANEWLAVILISVVVLALEAVNTAIESVVDLVSPSYHPLAGRAKDVAAGAVLIAAIGALMIAAIIVWPRLAHLIAG
nr:diacylglycerol kinase family protein [Herpetosiphon llansteffanensis]